MSKDKLVIYAANPSGFSDGSRAWLRDVLLPKLSDRCFDVINPWEGVMGMDAPQIRESARKMTHKQAMDVGESNMRSIERCDVVFAVLDGSDVDSGVAAEIGYAAAKGKTVIGVRTDHRLASEVPVCTVNLQVEWFIAQSGGRICDSVDEAVAQLRGLCVCKAVSDAAAGAFKVTKRGGVRKKPAKDRVS
jgi:nucleoside 2-deoxyribosyltransferase